MKVNESVLDRVIRVVLGLVLVGVGWFATDGALQIVLLVLGAIVLITGVIGFCAVYALLGISTKKAE